MIKLLSVRVSRTGVYCNYLLASRGVSVKHNLEVGGQIQSEAVITGVCVGVSGKRVAEPYERGGHRTAGPNS